MLPCGKRETMKQKQNFDHMLESAVVANWGDLMRGARGGLIHVEYGFAASSALEYLQIWSSISRGHWLLGCAYRMSASEPGGGEVHVENGYQSEALAQFLELVVAHQNAFAPPPDLGRAGLLQIATPTQNEISAAAAWASEAFAPAGSEFADPVWT
jgi:hypothetical protein